MTEDIVQRVNADNACVGVVGLGYVGLPLGLAFARKGVKVIGFDIDPKKIESLEAGKSYLKHIAAQDIGGFVKNGMITPTTDFSKIGACDAILMCVPTPLNANREPDTSYVESTGRTIAKHMRKGQLVVLESTTYPGTTDVLLREILEDGGRFKAGEDFCLAYSPEREDPGNPNFETSTIPKVVGGLTRNCREGACALYRRFLEHVVPVSSNSAAEMTKLLENIFRSVNIALVNELKVLCQRMDIDVWEVIEAAATKPFGYMPFYPGPGLGGHCIPIDPFYLTWKAREFELSTRFIELAGEINTAMPHYVVERTAEGLNSRKKALNGSKIMVLGVSYKKDVDDTRESPALRIMELLQEKGAEVCYHDPFVPFLKRMRKYDFGMSSVQLDEAALKAMDAVVVATDHTKVDYDLVVTHADLIIDTRNILRKYSDYKEKILKA